jgi:dTDP-4-dehydrorhamnose reductase
MPKVVVLGSTGMLGSAVFRELSKAGMDVIEASRTKGIKFDARELDSMRLMEMAGLANSDYIVNCVGLTKSRIIESSTESRSLAVRLNVDFPNNVALAAEKFSVRVIQVATDCVFSGTQGSYSELAKHDSEDVYGKTKSLGESPSEAVMHLRCSLIGPEVGRNSLFFEWVRQQPPGATIQGFNNRIWNGLTSEAFSRIIGGVVKKDQLVRLELSSLRRADVSVSSVNAEGGVDRTLSTNNADANLKLFAAAGYWNLPTIAEMVEDVCAKLAD